MSAPIVSCSTRSLEGYLPSKREFAHTYDSQRHAQIGGLDFFVDTWITARDAQLRKGSDGEHVRALLRAKGYLMPAAMASVRLVHLLDETERQESIIIYSEDLASSGGLTTLELKEGGNAHDQWPRIEGAQSSRRRARSGTSA